MTSYFCILYSFVFSDHLFCRKAYSILRELLYCNAKGRLSGVPAAMERARKAIKKPFLGEEKSLESYEKALFGYKKVHWKRRVLLTVKK